MPAPAVPITADTGYFWFFDDANVELVVKVLDGRSVNGHFWVFFGALSDVGYSITVTDTATGETAPSIKTCTARWPASRTPARFETSPRDRRGFAAGLEPDLLRKRDGKHAGAERAGVQAPAGIHR